MKPVDVKSSTYIDFGIENSKILNLKLVFMNLNLKCKILQNFTL